jgi:hypothetical protein
MKKARAQTNLKRFGESLPSLSVDFSKYNIPSSRFAQSKSQLQETQGENGKVSPSGKVSFLKLTEPEKPLVDPRDIKKFECKNIVQACFFLEHKEKFDNRPRYRDLDKELVLGDVRL